MKSYVKSIIFLSCILAGGSHVCGTEGDQKVEPAIEEGRTIIATFNIDKNHVGEDVLIINDIDGGTTNTRTDIDMIEIYKLCDNNGNKVERIDCDKEDGKNDKCHNFSSAGVYRIYYFFQEGFTITDMSHMFHGCSSLTFLDFSNFNTQNVIDMSYMFDGCSSLTKLSITSFETGSVMDMSYMFSVCSALTSLDLSNFNTKNVQNMSYMFFECSFLTTLNIINFNTNSVTDMSYMFYGCTSLTTLNLSSFDTQNVKNMSGMFTRCSSLTSLNLSNFNTERVKSMDGMFYECSSLADLNLSNFKTDSAKGKDYLFDGCSRLENVTTNDKYINDLFKDSKAVRVLNPNSCCCPCC